MRGKISRKPSSPNYCGSIPTHLHTLFGGLEPTFIINQCCVISTTHPSTIKWFGMGKICDALISNQRKTSGGSYVIMGNLIRGPIDFWKWWIVKNSLSITITVDWDFLPNNETIKSGIGCNLHMFKKWLWSIIIMGYTGLLKG